MAEQGWLLSCELLSCGLQKWSRGEGPALSLWVLAFPQTEAGIQSCSESHYDDAVHTTLSHEQILDPKGLFLLKEISEIHALCCLT